MNIQKLSIKKRIQGCDWCGEEIVHEPRKAKGNTAPRGQWDTTTMHNKCRKIDKKAYQSL